MSANAVASALLVAQPSRRVSSGAETNMLQCKLHPHAVFRRQLQETVYPPEPGRIIYPFGLMFDLQETAAYPDPDRIDAAAFEVPEIPFHFRKFGFVVFVSVPVRRQVIDRYRNPSAPI